MFTHNSSMGAEVSTRGKEKKKGKERPRISRGFFLLMGRRPDRIEGGEEKRKKEENLAPSEQSLFAGALGANEGKKERGRDGKGTLPTSGGKKCIF